MTDVVLQLFRVIDIMQLQIFKSIYFSRNLIVIHNIYFLLNKSSIFWSNSKMFATFFSKLRFCLYITMHLTS